MFNKQAGVFYRGINKIKPRGEAEWLCTPIKHDPRVYWTTSKTFPEKLVSIELIARFCERWKLAHEKNIQTYEIIL